MEWLQHHFVITLSFIAIISLIIGSFLNVVIYRLPIIMQRQWRRQCDEFLKGEQSRSLQTLEEEGGKRFNLLLPPSHCPSCKAKIRVWENIPLISYLILRGRCSQCSTPISLQYPLIELLSVVLAVIVILKMGISIAAVSAIILSWSLLVLTVIDLEHQILPDDVTQTLLWAGLLLNIFGIFTDINSAIIGAMSGYFSLWLINKIFKLITGQEGMGYGDFKLFALFGAWFGWQLLPFIILASSAVGACVGIGLIIFKGHDRQVPIPFGPYLAAAGWIAMLWGSDILKGYFGTVG